jgi:hypothetical protein
MSWGVSTLFVHIKLSNSSSQPFAGAAADQSSQVAEKHFIEQLSPNFIDTLDNLSISADKFKVKRVQSRTGWRLHIWEDDCLYNGDWEEGKLTGLGQYKTKEGD